ncbi:uncharacterized protein LOC114254896 [Monomorium pharaonis]|uniref:uncharacterized protein LOC114254896 n=1 Tax=Monomorium pharaonis TaxID=307658 RepID=UPI0017478430|nr:uncharacterized protein LOC114254896 [Monomorium pharaonis]
MEKNLTQLKVAELKERLVALGLSTTGTKTELVSRLCAADPSGEYIGNFQMEEKSPEAASGAAEPMRSAWGMEELVREVALLKREREVMERERRLLERENELLRSSPSSTASLQQAPHKIGVKSVIELLCDFDGVKPLFCNWERQVKLLCTTYQLDDNAAKILIGARVKGKALQWLHSSPEHIEMSVEELLKKMTDMFDLRPSKMVLRKEFESRKWKPGETFSDYYHAKIVLANNVPVEETELVDYIIDGIADTQLQNQARIQRFKSKAELLAAFEKITISDWKNRSGRNVQNQKTGSRTTTPSSSEKTDKDISKGPPKIVRCYNCDKTGHWAKECQLPAREKGACFSCGETGHVVKDCTKGQVNYVHEMSSQEEEFKQLVTYKLSNSKVSYTFQLETLIDTGSPVTFVKAKHLPSHCINKLNIASELCGINNSKLNIQGSVNVHICFDGVEKKDLTVYVVPNDTMRVSAVLGRDVLKIFGLSLTKPSRVNYNTAVAEILNIEVSNDTDIVNKMNISSEIPVEYQEKLKEEFRHKYVEAESPVEPKIKTELKLVLTDTKPFHYNPRRLSQYEKTELKKILDNLLQKGIIRESESEYASPIVLVKKKSGDLRMCVDYRHLNKIILRENHPIPVIEEQIEIVGNKCYFSILDLKDGFYHINIVEESRKFTAFVTPFGVFEFTKMPFGLKPAPQIFQKHIYKSFKKLIESGDVGVYMDDVIVATVTIEDHIKVLSQVFEILNENNLVLRLDKCKFLYTNVDYLGYSVSSEGVGPTKAGVQGVIDFPIPRDIHRVHSFVGLCSYFHKFIKDFSVRAKPLYDLLKKDTSFQMGERESKSFEDLKDALVKAPVLAVFNAKDSTELHCDASSIGFGAVLLQKKADRKLHPIFYFSKRTTNTESKYHSFELETLAIIYALRRFRNYLIGVKFKIVSDCNALKLTLDKKDLNPRIARWALELQDYDYTIEHRSGNKMKHVDALSRITDVLVVEDNPFEFNLSVCQSQDATIKELRERLEKKEDRDFELRNGIVYRKMGDSLLFYVPENMESNVIYRYHDSMGHLGLDKVRSIIKSSYWFPNMKRKIENHVQNCLKCIAFSPSSGRVEGFLHCIPKGNVPFATIHIDHYGPVDKQRLCKQYIFLVIDAFTKFVKLYATKSTTSKEVIVCLSQYFAYYSKPNVIVSDRGTAFTSAEFTEFIEKQEIKHVKIATGSPRANGQIERVNRVVTPMLAKITDSSVGDHWYKMLEEVEYALNNTVHKSTKEIPSKLLFGVTQRGKVTDYIKEYVENDVNDKDLDLGKVRDTAAKEIETSQKYAKDHFDRKRKKPHQYEVGDRVMVRNFDSKVGVSRKLIPNFKGPYEISKKLRNDRYVVKDIEGHQITQKPYMGTWEAANLRPYVVSA